MTNMKLALILTTSILLLMTGCIGSSTNFTNRSITYQLTPSIEDGKSNTINDSPKMNDAHLQAEKTNETKSNIAGTGDLSDASQNEQGKDKK